MPNWCKNKLIIQADSVLLQSIKSSILTHEINPNSLTPDLTPYPQFMLDAVGIPRIQPWNHWKVNFGLLIPQPDRCIEGWHAWRCNNWGCKWDPAMDDTEVVESENQLSITMLTPNSPPEPWVKALAERFPEAHVTLYYVSVESEYFGVLSLKDGLVKKDKCYRDDWDNVEDEDSHISLFMNKYGL